MFTKQTDFVTTYSDSRIVNWKSERTGMQVVLVRKQTPMVNGYFTVPTEIDNDSGCPHTLEHLVFMGSEKYPYKGLLDTIGNQMYSGTNAWTDTDQTVYTLTTAGWDGFKTLLPVYLDHVLHPTLTDDACLTEVYHVDGNGEEKGVVFSEIQGVENTSESLINLRLRQLMYSQKSGFSSETGGLMDALRVLTNEQIRDFHKLRYTPDNLCVVVAGDVDPDDLIAVMTEFDDQITEPRTMAHRSFIDSPRDPPPKENITETVEFPELDESFAEVEIGFMGPDANDIIDNTAIDVLGAYLTRQGVGKLNIELADVADPLATEIYYYTSDFTNTLLHFFVTSVPTEKLDQVVGEIRRVIDQQVKEFDLNFVRDCLERKKQKFVLQTEQDTQVLVNVAISNFIYGSTDGKDLERWAGDLSDFETLEKWGADEWINVLKKYLVDGKHIAVLGKPSSKLYHQLDDDKQARLKEYQQKYGPDGLKKLQKRLDAAQESNNKPIPESVLNQFVSPDPSGIKFINSTTARVGQGKTEDNELQKVKIGADKSDYPLNIHFEEYPSEFVAIQVLFSSFPVDKEYLPYIDVIFRELFSLPMEIDGVKLSYDQVVRQVKRDTLENQVGCGNNFEETVVITVRARVENYHTAIEWVRRAMYDTVFDKERVEVLIDKHLNGLAEEKRDGSTVLSSSITRAHFTDRSLKIGRDVIASESFFESLFKEEGDGDDDELDYERVHKELEAIRKKLFTIDNMRVFVHGNISQLQSPVEAWAQVFDLPSKPKKLTELPRSFDVRTEQGKTLNHHAYITPMPATESSFLGLIGKCPTDYKDPDIPALALCCEYLQAVEGPLWRGVRGTGLAYGAGFARNVETGQLLLDIYRGADAAQAVSVAKKLVHDLAFDTSVPVDESAMQGAVCSLINLMASREANNFTAACSKYLDNELMQRGPDYPHEFMKRLRAVTPEQLRQAAVKYLAPLFDSKTSTMFVACHPSMVSGLTENFEAQGYTVNIMPLIEDEDDEGDSDEDEEDSDDN